MRKISHLHLQVSFFCITFAAKNNEVLVVMPQQEVLSTYGVNIITETTKSNKQ